MSNTLDTICLTKYNQSYLHHSRIFPVYTSLIYASILNNISSSSTTPNSSNNEHHNSNHPPKEQCKTCLITGVLTCTAVSGYFFKTALLDLPESSSREVIRQKRFLLGFGSVWALAGAYRLYIE